MNTTANSKHEHSVRRTQVDVQDNTLMCRKRVMNVTVNEASVNEIIKNFTEYDYSIPDFRMRVYVGKDNGMFYASSQTQILYGDYLGGGSFPNKKYGVGYLSEHDAISEELIKLRNMYRNYPKACEHINRVMFEQRQLSLF